MWIERYLGAAADAPAEEVHTSRATAEAGDRQIAGGK